jgi:hypothetical protein
MARLTEREDPQRHVSGRHRVYVAGVLPGGRMSRDRESWEVMAREEGNGDTTVGRRLCALWLHWPPTPRMEGGVVRPVINPTN